MRSHETAQMNVAITNAERYRVLAGYHRDIFSAVEQRQLQRAMRLLFGFAEDYCLNFEGDVATLSETYQNVIDASDNTGADPSLFLQAFHRLWIAMEDHVLAEFPSETVDEATPGIAADEVGHGAGDSASLVDLKKAILLRSSQTRAPLVELKSVRHAFGDANAGFKLGPIDFTVPRGQIIGIVGPNGSGKTTLLRLIAGEPAPLSGQIDFHGLISQSPTIASHPHITWTAIRSKIAYVRPSPAQIDENTESTFWITGAAHGIRATELEQQVKVTMRKYGLAQYSDRLVSELSTGYRLRFELARILFTEPSLLVLDEPLANLDHNAQMTVLEDLKMLSASVDTPRSIVISSQHIKEIAAISDYLMFLSDGKVLFSGRREQVSNVLEYALFDIIVDDRPNELERLLMAHGAIETDRTPVSVMVLFPKGTDPQPLLLAIVEAGFRILSFRDLSDAIEMLMLMPRFRASRSDRKDKS
jgi:ABC-2 type transport system ATP-binding protein